MSQEISDKQKKEIWNAIKRLIKRFGTSPPQFPKDELFEEVKEELRSVCSVPKKVCFRHDALTAADLFTFR